MTSKVHPALQEGLQILASIIADQVLDKITTDQEQQKINEPVSPRPAIDHRLEESLEPKEYLGERLLRAEQVIKKVGVSRSTIWRWEQAGKFPKRRKIGHSSVAWLASEIDEWIAKFPTD